MIWTKAHPWNWLMPATIALCTLPLIAAIDAGRLGEPVDEPWPQLLSDRPSEIDPDIAMLQLRANLTLARLVEAGHAAE